MILFLGPKNSGKTVLLKRLQEETFHSLNKYSDIPATVSTVGTNIVHLKSTSTKEAIIVQEIGGQMSPIWNEYIDDCEAIVFVVDSSDVCILSESSILLLNLVKESVPKQKRLCVVLNKTDIKGIITVNEIFKDLLFLDSLTKRFSREIEVFECSAVTAKGLHQLYECAVTDKGLHQLYE
ncbi:ADP-ribosylation factor-like protein 16, partial [Leptotrombidium deliense]